MIPCRFAAAFSVLTQQHSATLWSSDAKLLVSPTAFLYPITGSVRQE